MTKIATLCASLVLGLAFASCSESSAAEADKTPAEVQAEAAEMDKAALEAKIEEYNSQNTPLPDDVRETWRLYNNTAAIYDKHVSEGPMWMRDTLSKIAGWRLKTGRYKFPVEQKLFDIYVRATGQTQAAATDYVPAVDA